MEKSWNMKKWQNSWHFVISHGTLPNLVAPESYQICASFVDVNKFGICLDSPHFLTFSAKCCECKYFEVVTEMSWAKTFQSLWEPCYEEQGGLGSLILGNAHVPVSNLGVQTHTVRSCCLLKRPTAKGTVGCQNRDSPDVRPRPSG